MKTFNVGDRVRFTWPPGYPGRSGSFIDGTVVGPSSGEFVHIRYDIYEPDKICTPHTKNITLLEQPVDETEAFFV